MHEPTYLMRLFPWSLGGSSIHWFSKLTPTIKTFEELIKLFYQQYLYNIQHPVTMIDICNLKQKMGEPFLTFLKRWRKKFSLYARQIQETKKLEIFINNLIPEINYHLQM